MHTREVAQEAPATGIKQGTRQARRVQNRRAAWQRKERPVEGTAGAVQRRGAEGEGVAGQVLSAATKPSRG